MSIPSFSLEGKVAIVTGGKEGIGKGIALGFAEAGADVVVCSRALEHGELLQTVADEIRGLGRRSLAVRADITRRTDVDNLVQKVVDEFGGIDILVNNAGVLIEAPMLEVTEEDWNKTIDTDLRGYHFCCQATGQRMVEQKRGNIINIASGWAFRAEPGAGVYCIAKAGVVMLTKVLALELAHYNIRVNAISPGAVRTRMIQGLLNDPMALKQYEAKIPLGRTAYPADLIGTAIFLASEASSHITGHTFHVDGGFYA